MGRRRRMNDQTLRIADVSQVRNQLQAFDEFFARFETAADAKAHDGASAVRQIFLGEGVIAAGRQPRIIYPGDLRMSRKKSCNLLRVVRVGTHAQLQSLQSLQKQKRVKRAKRRTE